MVARRAGISGRAADVVVSSLQYDFYLTALQLESPDRPGPTLASANVSTLQDRPSAAPLAVRPVALNASSISVSWQAPPPEGQNGVLVGYVPREEREATCSYAQPGYHCWCRGLLTRDAAVLP